VKADQRGRLLLFISVLVLAGVGQYYFARKPDNFWDGVIFYGLAAVLFLFLVRPNQPAVERPSDARAPMAWRHIVRGLFTVAGLVLGLLVVTQVGRSYDNYWPLFWFWVAAMGIYVLSFAGIQGWERIDVRSLGRSSGWEGALVVALVIGAFVLRAWHIETIPWTLGGDEGSQGLWARQVLQGQVKEIFGTGWLSVPNLSFFWQAGWLELAGDNILGLRLPWAVVGTLTVLGTYLLTRRLFGRWMALLTAFLLAVYHFHIHYSRLGSNQVADPLFTVWAIYFMVVGWQGNRRWAWAVSGIVAGLALYFYAGSRQVPVILLAVIVWASITEHDFLSGHRSDLLAMLGGFAIAAGPMLILFVRHPNEFNARVNQVGLIQSGLLDRIAELTGHSKLRVLLDQFKSAFFAFTFYRDRVAWYGASIPLMDFLASIFFMLGLVFSAFKLREWRYAVFVFWFILVIVFGGALTENPPSSQRLVSSAVPAVFFVAVALRELSRVLRDLLQMPELGRRLAVLAVAGVLAFISLRFYFVTYQESWTYGSFNAEVATRIGYYLRDLGAGWEEYFLGAPRMYADFGSTPFIAKGVSLYDVHEPLTGPPTFVDPNHNAVFVFLPERIGELSQIQETYPTGILEEVHRRDDPGEPLLFTAYKVEQK
jgi:hypothetical protein